MSLFSLARRNLKRSVFRSAAIALSVSVVAASLFSVAAVMGAAGAALGRGADRFGAELMIVPKGDFEAMTNYLAGLPGEFRPDMPHDVLARVRSVKGVGQATPLFFHAPADNSSSISIVGYDPETDFTIRPWLKQGRTLSDTDVLAGMKVSHDNDGKVRLYGRELRITGRLEPTGLHFLDNSVILPLSAAWELAGRHGRISAIMAQPEAGFGHVDRLGLLIQRNITGVKALTTEEMISSVRKQLSTLMNGVYITAAVIWLIALIMIGVVFSMTMNERQREVGLLRAMGATKMHVFGLAMLEASALSALGGGLGILFGGMLLFGFEHAIGALLNVQDFLPGPSALSVIIFACLLLSLVSGAGAALLPALRSSLMDPYDAIHQGM